LTNVKKESNIQTVAFRFSEPFRSSELLKERIDDKVAPLWREPRPKVGSY